MSCLLDTHVLIWLLSRRRTPRPEPVEMLENSDGPVLVSAVSAFEIATKVRLGKLDDARMVAQGWDTLIPEFGAAVLPLTGPHGILAGRLDWTHRDPFDRLLAAQSIIEGLTLVTADPAFDTAPGVALLRW